eukprot:3481226-Rhodomonas_salina.1
MFVRLQCAGEGSPGSVQWPAVWALVYDKARWYHHDRVLKMTSKALLYMHDTNLKANASLPRAEHACRGAGSDWLLQSSSLQGQLQTSFVRLAIGFRGWGHDPMLTKQQTSGSAAASASRRLPLFRKGQQRAMGSSGSGCNHSHSLLLLSILSSLPLCYPPDGMGSIH